VLEALARSVYSGLAWVRRHPLFAFLVGAFAFSWGDWLSLAATGERIAPGRLPTDMAGMAGPAFAAFAVAAIGRGEAGVRALALRLVRIPWRSAWFWILAPSAVTASACSASTYELISVAIRRCQSRRAVRATGPSPVQSCSK
jgi:hypothetical protein